MYLFFDTETTGLPKNWGVSYQDVDNWPRIIQLAFIVVDENMNIIQQYCELIKPDGWVIPTERFWIDNGYSTEMNMEKGIPIQEALEAFGKALKQCKYLIAHNIKYDEPVISAELLRKNMRVGISLPTKICTMMSSRDYCDLPRKKWPKLIELHEKLFGVGFDGAHDALADVTATVRCFFRLQQMKIINI